MHLITRHAKLHKQLIFVPLPNDVNFIPNKSINIICPLGNKKARIMMSDYPLQNKHANE
jgi:hypothetical protein